MAALVAQEVVILECFKLLKDIVNLAYKINNINM